MTNHFGSQSPTSPEDHTAGGRAGEPPSNVPHLTCNAAHPGMVLQVFQQAKETGQLSDDNAAAQITAWVKRLLDGPGAFKHGFYRARRRIQAKLLVFAAIVDKSNKIKLVHGIEEITLDNENHVSCSHQ